MPRVQRNRPMWQQVATHYKEEILAGRLREGDRLPSIRQIREEWDVSQGVAQQAVAHLHLAEKLVRTDPSGVYVAPPRAAVGPQQRLRLAAAPEGEDVTVTAAGLQVPAPDYVRPMFGLDEGRRVIRREEVTRRNGAPHMLAVTWCAPEAALPAPELLHAAPLPDPRGAAHLIAVRLGLDPDGLSGGIAAECRAAKDDGRELPALGLEPGAFVLAVVEGWRHGEELLAYTEYILPPGQVVEADIDPA